MDDGAVLALLRDVLGEAPDKRRTADAWTWKHRRNPFGVSRGLCAWAPSGEAVGVRVLMRWRLRDGTGALVPAVRAVDTAIHLAYRRRGLFTALTRRAIESTTIASGAAFVFNTPNTASLAGYRKLGWRLVTRWPLSFHVRDGARFARRRAAGSAESDGGDETGRPAQTLASRWAACFGPDVTRFGDFLARDARAIVSLVRRAENARPVRGYRTPRTLRYLRWRYADHPHLAYGVHAVRDRTGLAGFVVMRPNRRNGLDEVLVTDMMLGRQDATLARDLLARAVDATTADYLVAHFAAGSLEARALRAAGFRAVRGESIPFAVRPLRRVALDPLRPRSWDLTLGDLEVF